MAKQSTFPAKNEKYPYPSHYGSHSSMIDKELTKKLKDKNMIVCKDEIGCYVTYRNRLDNNLADPRRHSSINARDLRKWGIEP